AKWFAQLESKLLVNSTTKLMNRSCSSPASLIKIPIQPNDESF
ncbi:12837_t:CDS:1, partial [Funneliformis mosseae]